jgi:hypothetical protein
MRKGAASKVMWVGRATVFAVGLAVILALAFAAASMVLGVNGGRSLPGDYNQINPITQLAGSDVGANQVLNVDPLAMRRTPTEGYAQVLPTCTSAPTPICTFEDSKAVKGVTRTTPPGSSTANLYCFNLAFIPHVAVASPFVNNNAVVATAARDDVPASCTAPYTDAAARTYAADTGENRNDIGFAIIFK